MGTRENGLRKSRSSRVDGSAAMGGKGRGRVRQVRRYVVGVEVDGVERQARVGLVLIVREHSAVSEQQNKTHQQSAPVRSLLHNIIIISSESRQRRVDVRRVIPTRRERPSKVDHVETHDL